MHLAYAGSSPRILHQRLCDPCISLANLPVGGGAVVLMRGGLPGAISPGIITKFGRVTKLRFGDSRSIAAKRGIILQRRPGDRVVAVCQPQESAETYDDVRYSAGNFLDQQVINLELMLFGKRN